MPEERGRNTDERAVRELFLPSFYGLTQHFSLNVKRSLANPTYSKGGVVDNYFVKASFDQSAAKVLELFTRLH